MVVGEAALNSMDNSLLSRSELRPIGLLSKVGSGGSGCRISRYGRCVRCSFQCWFSTRRPFSCGVSGALLRLNE